MQLTQAWEGNMETINLTLRFKETSQLFEFLEDLKALDLVPARTAIRHKDALDAGGLEMVLYGGGDGREVVLVSDVTEEHSVAYAADVAGGLGH